MAVSNGHLPNSYEEGEDKPMLVVKKAGDGPGITALLNRQLQGEIYSLKIRRLIRLRQISIRIMLYIFILVYISIKMYSYAGFCAECLDVHHCLVGKGMVN